MTRFPDISPTAWEHPTDRAAMQALRALPAFDTVVRKVIGAIGERNIKLMFSAQALEVTTAQYPDIFEVLEDVCNTLDTPVPRLYVSQSPEANAGALGVDRPFIVLSSSVVELASTQQLRFILGHHVGAVMSEQGLYRTVLYLLLNFTGPSIPLQAVTPVTLALLEWHRKSMISNDRAGLIASQDLEASITALGLLAGGIRGRANQIDITAVRDQSRSYSEASGLDLLFKFMATAGKTQPFPMMRVHHLDQFVDSDDYRRIATGDYVRRGEEEPLASDLSTAASAFSEGAQSVFQNADEHVRNALFSWIDAVNRARESHTDDSTL